MTVDIDPEIVKLGVEFAEVAARNTAAIITDKIRAAKTNRDKQQAINELEQIISELISDKQKLIRLAQAYQDELVGRRISAGDIKYINEKLVPIVEQLAANSDAEGAAKAAGAIELIKPLLSVEMMHILQLIGFNFRRAIGEPLTELVASLITSKSPSDNHGELESLQLQREIAIYKLALDGEAYARLKELLQPRA